MFKRLYGYLEYYNILHPLQFGFRQKCSTNHPLIQITESIRNSTETMSLAVVFLLNQYGVRGKAYDWFRSYLSNRELYLYVSMVINLILSQSHVEYLRDPFLDPCCFCYKLLYPTRPALAIKTAKLLELVSREE